MTKSPTDPAASHKELKVACPRRKGGYFCMLSWCLPMQDLFVRSVTLPLAPSSPPGSLVVCAGLSFILQLCTESREESPGSVTGKLHSNGLEPLCCLVQSCWSPAAIWMDWLIDRIKGGSHHLKGRFGIFFQLGSNKIITGRQACKIQDQHWNKRWKSGRAPSLSPSHGTYRIRDRNWSDALLWRS